MSKASQVAIAEVVAKDHDEVGFVYGNSMIRHEAHARKEQKVAQDRLGSLVHLSRLSEWQPTHGVEGTRQRDEALAQCLQDLRSHFRS